MSCVRHNARTDLFHTFTLSRLQTNLLMAVLLELKESDAFDRNEQKAIP